MPPEVLPEFNRVLHPNRVPRGRSTHHRRVDPEHKRLIAAGIVLDVTEREVEAHGEVYHLTPKECRLLEVLMEHAGQTLTREFLMREVWETTFTGDMRTLEVHISWLRAKIEVDRSNPTMIQTVRKVGYRFVGPGEVETADG